MSKQTVGEFLATQRKAKGLTQEEVAEKLGVSSKTLSSWETNRTLPDLTLLPALGELYGVTADEIVAGERMEKPDQVFTKNVYQKLLKRKIKRYRSNSMILSGFAIGDGVLFLMALFLGAFALLSGILLGVSLLVAVLIVVMSAILSMRTLEFIDDDEREEMNGHYKLIVYRARHQLVVGMIVYLCILAIAGMTCFLFVPFRDYITIGLAVTAIVLAVGVFVLSLLMNRKVEELGEEKVKQVWNKNQNLKKKVVLFTSILPVLALLFTLIMTFWHPVLSTKIEERAEAELSKITVQAGEVNGYTIPTKEFDLSNTEWDKKTIYFGDNYYLVADVASDVWDGAIIYSKSLGFGLPSVYFRVAGVKEFDGTLYVKETEQTECVVSFISGFGMEVSAYPLTDVALYETENNFLKAQNVQLVYQNETVSLEAEYTLYPLPYAVALTDACILVGGACYFLKRKSVKIEL